MLSRRGLLLLAPLVALAGLAPAQTPDALPAVKPRMQKFVDDGDIAGAVTVVGRADGAVHHEAVGFRDLAAKEPMKPDALFRIASMTKPITAIGIMILADEGKLSPDDDVEKYLPEFKGQMLVAEKGAEPKKPSRPIKIRDLLTHTSGLPSAYPGDHGNVYAKRNYTLAETTAVIAKQPLQFEPGAKWSYCNSGIDTLGRIIEVVSGESFESFLQKRVFEPLGMTDTAFYPTPAQVKRLAFTYNRKDGQLVGEPFNLIGLPDNPKHPIPAGGLVSSGADLSKLYRMMLHKGQLNSKRVISEKAVAEMTRVQTGEIKTGFVDGMGFGYGWAVVREPKGVTAMLSPGTFGHGGAFGTQGWIDPKQDAFFVLLIQRTGLANGDASPMRQALQEAAVKGLKK
ncbi:MAG: beta-lactamase family protein [Gemmataceae bacterium]|nr:beta-lactamase family protein [Gemmataceae bacterium]